MKHVFVVVVVVGETKMVTEYTLFHADMFSSSNSSFFLPLNCTADNFRCNDGKCIPKRWMCGKYSRLITIIRDTPESSRRVCGHKTDSLRTQIGWSRFR